jgi:hypothetical protein
MTAQLGQSVIESQDGIRGYGTRERGELMERSKVMVGRTPNARGGLSALWWRITVYVGDSREIIDQALEEALRLDAELRDRTR